MAPSRERRGLSGRTDGPFHRRKCPKFGKGLVLRESPGGKSVEKCGKKCEKVPKRFCPLVVALQFFSDNTETLQTVTLQVKIELFFFVLGNLGASGKQEHGRELCADFSWLFARV